MKRFFRIFASFATLLCTIIMGFIIYVYNHVPTEYQSVTDTDVEIKCYMPLKAKKVYTVDSVNTTSNNISGKASYNANLMLMGSIPVKNVNVETVEETKVTPCGTPFGIKIFTKGVVVIGMTNVQTSNGMLNPALEAGLREGDVIVEVNDQQVNSNEEFANIIQNNGESEIKLSVLRDNVTIETLLTPVKSCLDNTYKIGLWVRDSSAGIGSLTFYNEDTGDFAGLGHGICDVDTGELMPLMHGDIVKAHIAGITKGEKGNPGELKGYFSDYNPIGTLSANTNTGIYGTLNSAPIDNEKIAVAMKQQVKTGSAKVLTTISGETPDYYEIEITNVNYNENCPTKNMVITIKDERLLEATGGIVQGMSGSPIIQDGKLVGAVTHVFINDSKKGYGIFAETMLKNSQDYHIKDQQKAA